MSSEFPKSDYLSPGDEGSWTDFPPIAEMEAQWRRYWPSRPMLPCPKCHGHGGWNLTLNAYQLRPGMEDTPENRHKHVHFRASCSQCTGWGYVADKADVDCVHVADADRPGRFNCCTIYRCTKCGKEWEVDSSD